MKATLCALVAGASFALGCEIEKEERELPRVSLAAARSTRGVMVSVATTTSITHAA